MVTPDWYPDEVAHAGDEHLEPDYVLNYDRKAGFDPTADLDVLSRFGLDGTQTVVDLGAGTGVFAMAAAPRCRRVVAVDVSAPMLRSLEGEAERRGITNIEPVQAGFLTYQHTGDPPDVVFSRNALHHLPDFWKALALSRIALMLRPGGILRLHDLVYDFDPADIGAAIEPWLAGAAPTPKVGWTRAEYETHLREEHSTFTWLLEPMLERIGFTIRDRTISPNGIYASYTCARTGQGNDRDVSR